MGFLDDLLKPNLNPQLPGQEANMPNGPMRDDYQPEDAAEAAPAQTPVNPSVMNYLKQKHPDAFPETRTPQSEAPDQPAAPKEPSAYDKFQSQYGADAVKKAQADAEDQKSGLGWAQFIAGAGDALAGRSSAQTAQNFQNIRKGIDDRTVGALEKQRAAALQDISTKKAMEGSDPNSEKSKVVQNTIRKLWGDKFSEEEISKVTADDADLVYKPMELKSKLEEQHLTKQMQLEMMRQSQQDRMDKKSDAELMKIQQMSENVSKDPAVSQAERDLYASKKANSLFNMYKANPNDMKNPEVNLYAMEIAKMASGGVPTIHELQGLNPSTIPGWLTEAAQKASGNPTAANKGEFVKAFKRYSDALAGDAKQVILDKYGRIYDPYAQKYKDNQVYQSLREKHMNRFLNDDHKSLSPEDQQAIQWAKQNPKDPRAQQILQMHSGGN